MVSQRTAETPQRVRKALEHLMHDKSPPEGPWLAIVLSHLVDEVAALRRELQAHEGGYLVPQVSQRLDHITPDRFGETCLVCGGKHPGQQCPSLVPTC